jgi:hypothetical protein
MMTLASAAIARLTNLTDLNIDFNPVLCSANEAVSSAMIACLSALSRIKRLSMCGCDISTDLFERFHSQVFKLCSCLSELELSFNVGVGLSDILRTLPRDLSRLTTLKLASVNLKSDISTDLISCAMQYCSELSCLDITCNDAPPFQVIHKARDKIQGLVYGPVFRTGRSGVEVTGSDADMRSYAMKFDMDRLRSAHDCVRMQIEYLHKSHQHCEALVLDGSHLKLDAFASKKVMIAALLRPIRTVLAPRLSTLVLRNMDIGPGLSHVVASHITLLTGLIHFDYYGNYAGSDGVYSICRALPYCSNLHHLDLGCNYMNADSVHFFVYALSNLPSLRSLSLAAPPALTPIEHRARITLGNTGLQVLCKGIANSVAHTSITHLNLEGAAAAASGMEAIANCISGMRRLVYLNISYNSVSPACSSVLATALGCLSMMVALHMNGCFDSVHGTQDMCFNVLSCIYSMPRLRCFSCGFNLEEVDMRLMLGHVPHQTTTHLSLGVPLPREYAHCVFYLSPKHSRPSFRYISGRLPAYHNLQSLTWCITALTEKQQTSFSKSVAALFGTGLSYLTLFCDEDPDAPAVAVSSFAIKGIVAAAADAKALKEINFVRLCLHPPCVASALQAPVHVQRCLMFHGAPGTMYTL